MSLRIYNSLTQKKEEFVPRKRGRIEIYVCGPTVYDDPHIGHARSAYIFDVIVRYLRYKFEEHYRDYNLKKRKVFFVRNITDVDDKIIEKARRSGFPKRVDFNNLVREVAAKYTKAYHDAMDMLGLDKPDKEPKATKHINDMQAMIKILIKKGYAYDTHDGNVYFRVRESKHYGQLSKKNIDQLRDQLRDEEGRIRLQPGENKEDLLDFALWKSSKPDEPEWPSPWGRGRPGWHIECSTMSGKYFKGSFDIHGGGLDLIFPHHENEIAQSKAAGYQFAKYWMHNGLLTINNQKMAKSLENFITINDFLTKHKNPNLLKMLFLSSHYRHSVDYTEEKIEEMKKAEKKISSLLYRIKMAKETHEKSDSNEPPEIHEIEKHRKKFMEAMDDDFNMPKALSYIFDLVSLGYGLLAARNFNRAADVEPVILELCEILGIPITAPETVLIEEENRLMQERDGARRNKDFKKADEIRQKLFERGIILQDPKKGPSIPWRKRD